MRQSFEVQVYPTDDEHISEYLTVKIPEQEGDADAGVIRLLREKPGSRPFSAGLGWSLDGHKGCAVIRAVAPGGPVAKQGVVAGSLFLAIDGREASEMGPGAVVFLLDGEPNTRPLRNLDYVTMRPALPLRAPRLEARYAILHNDNSSCDVLFISVER